MDKPREDVLSQHDKNDRAQPQQNKPGKRIGTSVLLAAASLLGSTLGVAAITQEEPAASPAQGQTAESAERKALAALYIKSMSPKQPHVSGKTVTPSSKQLKYQTPGSFQHKGMIQNKTTQ